MSEKANTNDVKDSTVKAGIETTEYARAKSASVWGVVGMVLGTIVAMGPQVLETMSGVVPTNSKIYLVGGLVLSLASVLYKFGIDAGYIQSRTTVKAKAEESKIAALMTAASEATDSEE